MKRTLIEFYDPNFLENIVAAFGVEYDEILYLCQEGKSNPSPRDRERLTRFLEDRFQITPRFISLQVDSMGGMLEAFWELVSTGGRFDFDISGGPSMFVAAAGLFVGSCEDEQVFLVRYDVEQCRLEFCYPEDGDALPEVFPPVCLTVPEVISLAGASFLPAGEPRRIDFPKSALRHETLRLWDAVKDSLKGWNAFCTLGGPEKRSDSRTGKVFPARKAQSYEATAARLRAAGILSGEERRRSGENITVTYHLNVAEEAKVLYEKGGNVLEMLSYMAAVQTGAFHDICHGIMVDWDGVRGTQGNEPCNELDLTMTYGHIPVFVSCKGTVVENEYLYEIMAMANHFGGQYARPVLISGVRNRRSIHRRAAEMGVLLIDDVCTIGLNGLTALLSKHFPPKENV